MSWNRYAEAEATLSGRSSALNTSQVAVVLCFLEGSVLLLVLPERKIKVQLRIKQVIQLLLVPLKAPLISFISRGTRTPLFLSLYVGVFREDTHTTPHTFQQGKEVTGQGSSGKIKS